VAFGAACWLAWLAQAVAAADRPPWTVPTRFRLPVKVEQLPAGCRHRPVGVEVDFQALLRKAGVTDRLNPYSIRVAAGGRILPHTTTGDLVHEGKGIVWWRVSAGEPRDFAVHFDTRGAERPPATAGLVGVGDTFHYNHGRPDTANALPLHSQFLHLDWDGDGLRDLIGWGYRRWEFGNRRAGRELGNGVYFLKNVGKPGHPLFAPRYRLKGSDGKFLESELLPQNMLPADWDGDGDIDFHGMGRGYQLLLWNNSGRRDDRGLGLLDPPRTIATLDAESPFRRGTPGILRQRSAWYPRGVRRVDWQGDGDADLLVAYRKVSRLRAVDASRGVMPYGTAVMVFDLFENIGTAEDGSPQYAPPVTLREHTGFPIRARGHANGGPAYVDWDHDGDFDLLFHDETDRPLEGGRLMFAENRGSREAPLFEPPIPILPVADSPFLVDFNDDGRLDLIAGGEFFENVRPEPAGTTAPRTPAGTRIPRPENFPRFVSRGFAQQVQPELLTYFTVSVDWENDGDLDLLGGYRTGLRLFVNRGTTLEPVFDPPVAVEAAGKPIRMPNWLDPQSAPPFTYGPQGPAEPVFGWLCPTIGDWDGDGDWDLFVTGQRWQTRYFENLGTPTEPQLAAGREVRVEGRTDEFSWRSKVSLGDLDGDGRRELVVTSDRDNTFYLYHAKREQPDPKILDFRRGEALQLENGNPVQGWYGGQNNNGDNHSLLVDWDGDGDLDLLNGSLWAVWYYENVGTPRQPRFRSHGRFQVDGTDLHTFRHAGSFDAADWNEDGRLDLVLGTECPSDQPQGAVLHLFERHFLEGKLPRATAGELEARSEDDQ
jgi:hypothetical protein